MNRIVPFRMSLLAAVGFAAVTMTPAQSQHRELTMLDQLSDGRWDLHSRGKPDKVLHICLHDGRTLIQLRHPEQPCTRLVVEDHAQSVTVQYTCKGRGYGRTRIKRESDRLIQVESQGVAGGLPFDFAAEGRRVGDCPA